jgi:hypothetical protein
MFIVSSDTLRALVTKSTPGRAPPHRAWAEPAPRHPNFPGPTYRSVPGWTAARPVHDDPDGRVSRASEGDAVLGFAAFLLLMGASLMLTALVVSRRSQQTG